MCCLPPRHHGAEPHRRHRLRARRRRGPRRRGSVPRRHAGRCRGHRRSTVGGVAGARHRPPRRDP
ncbi:hypothetical protein EFE23_27610 [Micromonospora solifontis]|uniref:Uncharacterized protein n=1 Tax=Micromonospora solifontis TaxID=2487138 RepID=A0ABX9W7Z8_9ACTN|nr:hypothetical protein EFE23_27610 [Micromonospora solifontis]